MILGSVFMIKYGELKNNRKMGLGKNIEGEEEALAS